MKGISPLIASVLLIAFTVSVAMIVMDWIQYYVETNCLDQSRTSWSYTTAICGDFGCNTGRYL
jgi:flagellin-like protein